MLIFIDNHDSFTFNLVQYFKILGQQVDVVSCDAMPLSAFIEYVDTLKPSALILGPGPGTPADAGITMQIINYYQSKLPMLGICLGHQAIAQAFGAQVVSAGRIMHGRTSSVYHHGRGLFDTLSSPTLFTRYHSLIVADHDLPPCLQITAWTQADDSPLEVMALEHRSLPIYGVQFHPESILSRSGMLVLSNFLKLNHLTSLDIS